MTNFRKKIETINKLRLFILVVPLLVSIFTEAIQAANRPPLRLLVSRNSMSASGGIKVDVDPNLFTSSGRAHSFASGFTYQNSGRTHLSLGLMIRDEQGRTIDYTGREIVEAMIKRIEEEGANKIDVLHARWLRNYGLSVNYKGFIKKYKQQLESLAREKNISIPNELNHPMNAAVESLINEALIFAARNTWTGSLARSLGFESVESIFISASSIYNPICIDVHFSRDKVNHTEMNTNFDALKNLHNEAMLNSD